MARKPTAIERPSGSASSCLDLHVVGAVDGDQAEEEEDEDLAEAGVAVGPRAAGVEDAGGDREGADQEDHDARPRSPGRCRRRRRRAKAIQVACQHPLRGHQPGRGDPHRPEPVGGVGAALGVGVVVGEVGPDLDEDRADQGGDEGAARGSSRPITPPPRSRPAPARSPPAASAAAPPSARSSWPPPPPLRVRGGGARLWRRSQESDRDRSLRCFQGRSGLRRGGVERLISPRPRTARRFRKLAEPPRRALMAPGT